LIQVNVDPEHPTLYSLAVAMLPEGADPRPLADSLQSENSGSTLVYDGDAVYVTISDEALQLNQQQSLDVISKK
jgi:hypothetical protein